MLHRSIAKHGKDAFVITVVNQDIPQSEIAGVERATIKAYDTFFENGKGYNMTLGGEGTSGRVMTEEIRAKISKSKTGKKRDPETIKRIADTKRKNGNTGGHNVPHSAETKATLRVANLGKVLSLETRQKMSNARSGKQLSDESRRKRVGRVMSDETKQKISDARKARNTKEEMS